MDEKKLTEIEVRLTKNAIRILKQASDDSNKEYGYGILVFDVNGTGSKFIYASPVHEERLLLLLKDVVQKAELTFPTQPKGEVN